MIAKRLSESLRFAGAFPTHPMDSVPLLHPELALKAFEADKAFSAALAAFQAQASDHGTTATLLESANAAGFCWLFRPANGSIVQGLNDATRVILRHVGGAEEAAVGHDPLRLLLDLLGGFLAVTPQTAEPELATADPEPDPAPPAPPAAEVAAESLAAATGGQVFELAEGDPATPLTDEQKATAVKMVSDLSPAQRKSFAIAFRDGFKVDKAKKSIVPCITELRHLEFIDRFTVEAAGGVAP